MSLGPCREWSGFRNRGGYGNVQVNYRRWMVHRLAWTERHGPIPTGLHVLHRCDNPPCYEVDHLFLGDDGDNARDRHRKGRSKLPDVRGVKNGRAKLDRSKAIVIRLLYGKGTYTLTQLGTMYGVTATQICRIVKGKVWA